MKNYILLITILLLMAACKMRHTETVKSQLTDKSTMTEIKRQDALVVDTSKKKTNSLTKESVRDSAIVVIIPDSGAEQQIRINPDSGFNYIGKAKRISYFKGRVTEKIVDNSQLQSNGITLTDTKYDNTIYKKNITSMSKSKIVEAKANHTWILIAMLVIAGLMIYVVRRYKLFV